MANETVHVEGLKEGQSIVVTFYNTVLAPGDKPDIFDPSKVYKKTVIARGVDRKGYPCNHGPYTEYYNAPGEIVKKKGSFKGGRIDGELLEYYQDGKLSSKSLWRDGMMLSLQEFDQEGRVVKDLKGDL